MNTFIQKLNRLLEITVIVIMAVLVVDVLWQIFSRFILSNPSSFTDELARFLLIWVSLLGGAYMLGKRLHLSIDLLSHKLSEKQSLIVDCFAQIVILLFVVSVLIIGGSRLVFVTLFLEQTSAALNVPLGYVYSVLPISGSIMILYCIHFLIDNVRKIKKLNTSSFSFDKKENL
ncbi:MAG: TRAP transporter small permease [Balneola sp.]